MTLIRIRTFLLALFLLMSWGGLQAQFNLGFRHYDAVEVIEGGDTLRMPWAGGFNNPQFSMIDLNFDGEEDLIAYERDGEIMRGFAWESGDHYTPVFDVNRRFPDVGGSYVLFRDYDGDGKRDIFSAAISNTGLRVHRNVSTEEDLLFEEREERLWFNVPGTGNLYFFVPPNDLPVFHDFNGDGDMDVLLQGQTGFLSYPALLYFENQSQELYNTSDSLVYRLENPCWGRIREFITASGWLEYACDTSNVLPNGNQERNRHGGTTLAVFDTDGDGDLDLVTGDAYSGHLSVLFNTNENVDAVVDLSLSDTTFPSTDVPAFVPTLPATFFEDVDHDGDKDMLVTPNQLTSLASFYLDTSINANVDWYYRNHGTVNTPDLQLEKQGFLSGEMIDAGAKSMPVLADVNGDSLVDLLVGNEGYTIYGGAEAARIRLYLNVGNDTNPVFELHDSDVGDIASLNFGNIHPALADLDDDGDQDLMIGDENGRLHYFENQGTPSNYDFQLTEPEYADIDVDLGAHPQFFDLSGDGIEDLVIGDFYGRVQYHENAGTNTEPDFSKNPTIERIGDIFTYADHGGESTPYFTRKLDSLGTKLYLFLSNADGTILVYGPIEDLTTLDEPMQPADSLIVDATFTSLSGANLFGDFRDELIIGQRTGGLFAMRRAKEIPLGYRAPKAKVKDDLRVFPNPSDGRFNVELPKQFKGVGELTIFDLNGRLTFKTSLKDAQTMELDLSEQPNGIYFLQVTSDRGSWHERLVKQ
jgi:hypothetical protein